MKKNEVASKTVARGFVGKESHASMREHLEGEQAAFKTRQGYLFKKSGLVGGNPTKKKVKTEDNKDDTKKTAEAWLKKRRP